ncbi:hypothetical protein RFI_22225 [Reticulomyxa filosa]|uniref:Uncharacterized protein n=1 Tax=Reticulomyxa filosa TaxID=46433 RepID=X6MPW3_RETFI|nr:hypothetical protein RFI_22225 [Reticulomyxa filosa]|eukprot:ETO15140.1 hypothetical protein RFI_22225 [Reticulomyxa filosa]
MSFCILDTFERKLQIKYNTCYDSISGLKYSKYHYLHKKEDASIISYGNYISIYDIKINLAKKISQFDGYMGSVWSIDLSSSKIKKKVQFRSGKQICVFKGHQHFVTAVEYIPYIIM